MRYVGYYREIKGGTVYIRSDRLPCEPVNCAMEGAALDAFCEYVRNNFGDLTGDRSRVISFSVKRDRTLDDVARVNIKTEKGRRSFIVSVCEE